MTYWCNAEAAGNLYDHQLNSFRFDNVTDFIERQWNGYAHVSTCGLRLNISSITNLQSIIPTSSSVFDTKRDGDLQNVIFTEM